MNAAPAKSLPMYFPPGFVQAEASLCASLVLTAYDQYAQWQSQNYPSPSQFRWVPDNSSTFNYSHPIWGTIKISWLAIDEPFGFVAWDGSGNAYIVFRGTLSAADALVDAEIDQATYAMVSGFGNVQTGWNSVYATMSASLLGALNQVGAISRLFFTGHSMGSAYSTLAVPDVANNSQVPPGTNRAYIHYNFASPRVGDPTFAGGMNWSVQTPTFRIVNTEDVVPDVPPPETGSIVYQHVGTPVDFTVQYLSIDGNHSMKNCYSYAINNPTQPQGVVTGLTLTEARRLVRMDGSVHA
jgi:triacylglycerol lipase